MYIYFIITPSEQSYYIKGNPNNKEKHIKWGTIHHQLKKGTQLKKVTN